MSSTSAIHGAGGNEGYGTSNTALLGLVRALVVSLARYDIRVTPYCRAGPSPTSLPVATRRTNFVKLRSDVLRCGGGQTRRRWDRQRYFSPTRPSPSTPAIRWWLTAATRCSDDWRLGPKPNYLW